MKRLLVLAIASVVMLDAEAQTPPPQGTASISGTVVSGETGRPVGSMTVRLVAFDSRVSGSTRTNNLGAFEFTELPAGRYQVNLIALPRLTIPFGVREIGRRDDVTPIELRDGQRFDRADFILPRPSSVEGTVTDEFGDPVPDAVLVLSVPNYGPAGYHLMSVETSSPTDDKGRFRFANVSPGDYYLSAGPAGTGNASNGFALTLYPGVPTMTTASEVRVRVGQDLGALSFALIPARMARISGVVVDATGTPTAATIELRRRDLGAEPTLTATRSSTGVDGSFTIRNVPPGHYSLQASGFRGSAAFAPVGTTDFDIDGVDVTGVRISLSPGASARGRIVFDGAQGPLPAPADVRLGAFPEDMRTVVGGPGNSIVDADWTFSLEGQFGPRVLRAMVRQPEWVVKRVMLGTRDITDEPIDFSRGDVGGIEMTLTNRAAVVAGTVVDRAGTAPLNYTVLVFSADRSKRGLGSRHSQTARRTPDGRFKTGGLPPGDYLAVALPAVVTQEMIMTGSEVLERLEADATRLTLAEGEVKNVQLTLAPMPSLR